MGNEYGNQGTENPFSGTSEFNAFSFLIAQQIARLSVAQPVKVMAVYADTLTVDIMPLVNQLDGLLNAIPHGVIHNVPYMSVQGGLNAVIITPQVNDIGIAIFADRDISSVQANKAQANPGSLRRFDMADAMYIGGILNAAPTRYVKIDDTGVTIEGVTAVTVHGTTVTVNATTIALNGNTTVTGTFNVTGLATLSDGLNVTGDVVASGNVTGNGTSLHTHIHTGGTIAGKTGAPV